MRETLGQLDRIIKEEKRELALVALGRSSSAGRAGEAPRPPGRPRGPGARPEGRGRRHRAPPTQKDGERPARRPAGRSAIARPPSARPPASSPPTRCSRTSSPPHLKQADPHLERRRWPACGPGRRRRGRRRRGAGARLCSGRSSTGSMTVGSRPTRRTSPWPSSSSSSGDQDRNRGASDSLASASARLGDAGVALQKDLIRAGGSMQSAEERPGQDRGQARGRRPARGARST